MSYGNAGLNRVVKNDNSGFTPQQRHDIIIATLAEFGKGTQAFQLRWRENSGEYLTGDILLKTPMFWFMKYKWSRQEIEALFFKARVVIDEKFDMALQQTFGGDPGPRWKGGGGVKKKNWKRSQYEQEDRPWNEEEDEKKPKGPDQEFDPIKHPNFEYNPVIQPVDFQATGGVNNKDKPTDSKSYGKPGWERLKKKPTEDENGSGPKMGKGKIPSDNLNNENVNLQPIPDYSKWKTPSGDDICQIYINCPDGSRMTLEVKLNEPLHYVKKQIEHKSNGKYDPSKQILYFDNAQLMEDDATLSKYGISNGDVMDLSMGPIKIFVEKKDGNKLEIMTDPYAQIASVKKEIEKNTYPSIAANEQMLFKTKEREKKSDNELANNQRTLYDYNVYEGDTIYLGGPTVWRPPKTDDAYPIFVECPDGRTLTLNVTKNDDIGYTKLQIEQLTNKKYPVFAQKLYFDKNLLDDNDATLNDLNIAKNAVLQLSDGPITIFVETRNGKVMEIKVDPHESVQNLKAIIAKKTNNEYPIDEQQLFNKANKQELDDPNKSLFSYGITNNSELYLGGKIPVKIRDENGQITPIEIDPNEPCVEIKKIIQNKQNIPVKQQTLVFNNKELSDTRPAKAYNIQKNDIIDLRRTYPIYIQKSDGTRMKLDVSPNDNLLKIKQQIEDKFVPSVPINAQILSHNGKEFKPSDDAKPIKSLGIGENDVILLSVDDDDPEALLEKILSRDAPSKEREDALNKIHNNLVEKKNPKYDVLLKDDKLPLLVCGYSVQVLDEDYNKNPVAQTATNEIGDIFKKAMDKNNDLAIGSLDETLDSLFKIYDDPKCKKLHPYAKKAINRIVDDIIHKNEPKSVNKLVEKLGEKLDTENIKTPEVRQFAMKQLQKVMFPEDNELINKIFDDGAAMKTLPDVKDCDLAKTGSTQRKWFDVAIDDNVNPANNKAIGDKHRKDVAAAISEMITDPNRDNKQIGLNLADLFNRKNPNFKNRLDGHARPIFQKWKFGPLKPYNMKMPPKGPKKKYKVDPLEPVDYKIKQQQGLTIGGMTEMPDL